MTDDFSMRHVNVIFFCYLLINYPSIIKLRQVKCHIALIFQA